MSRITKLRLDELIAVDLHTGQLQWKVSRGRVQAGAFVGTAHRSRSITVTIDGTRYEAHRLVWLYATGEWPTNPIDHIDGDRSNNRLSNLRVVTTSQNAQNRRAAASHNKVGLLGVRYVKGSKTFSAQINVDGKDRWLGTFPSPELAHAAYVRAKALVHATGALAAQSRLTILEEMQAVRAAA